MTCTTSTWPRIASATLLCTALAGAQAASFSASVAGHSEITEVIDPAGPVVRVQTLASGSGSGSPGLLTYHSGDVIDLSTGQGAGTNRFVNADGDELHGSFSGQMVPGADASLFSLIGQVSFTGGTGAFLGATGQATFLGSGQFISASLALTQFEFSGAVSAVPEPGSWATTLAGLACLGLAAQRRRSRGRPDLS